MTDAEREPRWEDRAKCKGLDPGIFVGEPGQPLTKALSICHGWDGGLPCPVRAECHEAAERGQEWGVWGGNVRGQRGVRVIDPIRRIVDGRPQSA